MGDKMVRWIKEPRSVQPEQAYKRFRILVKNEHLPALVQRAIVEGQTADLRKILRKHGIVQERHRGKYPGIESVRLGETHVPIITAKNDVALVQQGLIDQMAAAFRRKYKEKWKTRVPIGANPRARK